MWIKFLKDFRTEKGTIKAGTVVWSRRSAKIVLEDGKYFQKCSVSTFEYAELICVLPDEAENDLYTETDSENS